MKILDCPFCGSTPDISETDDGLPRWVWCSECEADGPPIAYNFDGTNDEARKIIVDKWNTRTGTVCHGHTAEEWYDLYCSAIRQVTSLQSSLGSPTAPCQPPSKAT